MVSIFLGFGLGGIVIAVTVGTESFGGYLGFILLSIFVGFIYLSLSISISAYCKKRITSILGGLILFFWGLIYGTVLFAILLATGGSYDSLSAGDVPEWFFNSVVFSPQDLYQTAVQRAFGVSTIQFENFSFEIPDFLSTPVVVISLIIWFIIPLILGYIFFKRRDI